MDCSLPGSSLHGLFQERKLEWVAISFSRRSSWPRDWTRVSCIVGRRFTVWATREVHLGLYQLHPLVGPSTITTLVQAVYLSSKWLKQPVNSSFHCLSLNSHGNQRDPSKPQISSHHFLEAFPLPLKPRSNSLIMTHLFKDMLSLPQHTSPPAPFFHLHPTPKEGEYAVGPGSRSRMVS